MPAKKDCEECTRLWLNTRALFSEYQSRKDELALMRKKDAGYSEKQKEFRRLIGRLRESYRVSEAHEDREHRDSS